MSKSVLQILRTILYSDLRPVKWMLALSSLFWCVLLFMPEATFGRPTYYLMSQIANENVWATAFGIHFLFLVHGLFRRQDRHLALMDAFFGCVLWTTAVSCMLFSVYPLPAAISSEITSTFASWWILLTYDNNKK